MKTIKGLDMYAVETRAGILESTISRTSAEAIDKTVGQQCRMGGETNETVFKKQAELYGWKVVRLSTTFKNLGPVE